MNPDFLRELRALGSVRQEEPLARHVTFGVGGPADVYFPAKTEDQLRGAYAFAKRYDVPVFIFGSGSNILVGDRGIRGLVIENRTDHVEGPAQNGAGLKVRVASGVSFAALARRLSSAGYGGLEWAAGIPGSLGGAVVTNAGASRDAASSASSSPTPTPAQPTSWTISGRALQIATPSTWPTPTPPAKTRPPA